MTHCRSVLLTTDRFYVRHLAAALYSLLFHNRDLGLKVTILVTSISRADHARLVALASSFQTELRIITLDDNSFSGLPLGCHFQNSIYFRLLAPDIIFETRCLYMDSDVIVTGSIRPLLEVDLGDRYLAAVADQGFKGLPELGLRPTSKYFNTGLMLINLDKWREQDVRNSVVKIVKEKSAAIWFPDQCGLNALVDGNWFELSSNYNFQTSLLRHHVDICRPCEVPPVVIHFTGSSKPWQLNDHHPYKQLYWKYRNMTAYKALWPDDLGPRTFLRRYLPTRVKAVARRLRSIGSRESDRSNMVS